MKSLATAIILALLFIPSLRADDSSWKDWVMSIKSTKDYNAILTAYCNCQSCCSWHYNKKGQPVFDLRPNVVKKIGQTASGKQSKQGRTLALPRGFKFGSKVYYQNKLLGVTEDRGGAIIQKGDVIKIDIFFDKHKEALQFGKRKVMIWVKL